MKKLIHVGVVVFAVGCLDYTDRGVSPEFEAILAGQPGADAGSAEPGEGPVQPGPDGGSEGGSECETLWFNEIKPLMDAKCVACHGDPPAVGPNPLVTLNHMFAESPFGVPTYERVHFRMEQNSMPPSGGNTAEEIAAVAAWVEVCEAEASAPAVPESDAVGERKPGNRLNPKKKGAKSPRKEESLQRRLETSPRRKGASPPKKRVAKREKKEVIRNAPPTPMSRIGFTMSNRCSTQNVRVAMEVLWQEGRPFRC